MPRFPAALFLTVTLAGCGALSAVSDATEPLDAFTLSSVRPAVAGSGASHIVVPAAAASGAIATDRILIKPTPVQAAYLPAARWVDPAPVLIQSLLVGSLQSSAGFRLVSRDDAGLQPDFVVLLDLIQFQADAPAEGESAWTIRVGLTVTVIRDEDRSIVASRRFDATSNASGQEVGPVVAAFDAATTQVLREATAWIVRQTR